MLRSLNFWLFLVVLVCGISLMAASGISLPKMGRNQPANPVVAQDWKTDPGQQPVHLRILNGTGHSGLAREFSLLVSGRGCVVEGIGNAPGSWPESLLVNRRLSLQSAKGLARQLGSVDVIRQWDERLTEDAVLILGEDFAKLKAALLE
jgi:hypothetical protein